MYILYSLLFSVKDASTILFLLTVLTAVDVKCQVSLPLPDAFG